MVTNEKIVKWLFLAGLVLLCLLLPAILFRGENNGSQMKPPTAKLNGTTDEGVSTVVDTNKTIVASAGSEEIESSEFISKIDPNGDLAFLEKDILNILVPDSGNSKLTPKDFITRNGPMVTVEYRQTREVITKDDLPILYELLDDDKYAPYWNNVVAAIGFVSNDPDSVNVLLKFIQRNDNKKLDRFSIRSKSSAFGVMSLIGGDLAESILKKGVTDEGIKNLTKDWINEPLPGTFDAERIIRTIQRASLSGLVFTGKQENLELVEEMYTKQKEISLRNHELTDSMWALIDAMVEKDCIAEVGFETWKNMGTRRKLLTSQPYIVKYFSEVGFKLPDPPKD